MSEETYLHRRGDTFILSKETCCSRGKRHNSLVQGEIFPLSKETCCSRGKRHNSLVQGDIFPLSKETCCSRGKRHNSLVSGVGSSDFDISEIQYAHCFWFGLEILRLVYKKEFFKILRVLSYLTFYPLHPIL